MTSIFEPIYVAQKLEDVIKAQIEEWMPTYIREVERQFFGQMDRIPMPKSVTSRNQFDKFPEDQLPMIVVVNSGLADEPIKHGDGVHTAWWAIGIGIIASASTEEASRQITDVYGAAIRALLLQKPDIGGNAAGVEWVDEIYDDLPTDDQARSLRSARLVFRVLVDDVVTSWGGPAEPDDPDPAMPGSQWPTADDVIIETNIVDQIEEVP